MLLCLHYHKHRGELVKQALREVVKENVGLKTELGACNVQRSQIYRENRVLKEKIAKMKVHVDTLRRDFTIEKV